MKTESLNFEWVSVEHGTAKVGLKKEVQEDIGEIVYVELPKIGKKLQKGDLLAVLESTKAAIDFYSPISGTVVEINEALTTEPNLLNFSPEEKGWICKICQKGKNRWS